MKIFYIEDQNGKYASEDGSRRFTRLEGTAAYEFLRSPMGQGRRFMKLANIDSDEDEINIEVNSNVMKSFRMYERREQYVTDVANTWGYEVLSLYYEETADGEMLSEVVADEDVNVEKEAFMQIDLETLRKALDTLTEDEYALICALYLQDKPMTERAYSMASGIPQKTINDRKLRILKKLKSFF
jgi:DNA-directed RNA polymerase sigma subunit (sigma70/sigma32)